MAIDVSCDDCGYSFRVSDHVTPTNAIQVRFRIADNPNDSVTEAGVDAVRFYEAGCTDTGADIDGNGVVDFQDLLLVLAAWGPCGTCAEDIDGNGIVDFQDLLELLSSWS